MQAVTEGLIASINDTVYQTLEEGMEISQELMEGVLDLRGNLSASDYSPPAYEYADSIYNETYYQVLHLLIGMLSLVFKVQCMRDIE